MPILVAPFIAFALGVAFAWAARGSIAEDDAPLTTTRAWFTCAAFALLVFAPVCGYFVAFHGDWSYAYLLRHENFPSAIDLTLVLAATSTVLVGLATAASLLRRGRSLVIPFAAPLMITLVVLFALARRLAWSGSFAQFHGDFGLAPIASSPLGRGLVLGWIAIGLGLAWGQRRLA